MVTKRHLVLFGVGLLILALITLVVIYLLWLPHMADTGADPKIAALQRLENETDGTLEITFQNGFPRGVLGVIHVEGSNSVQRAANFLGEYEDFYLQNDPRLDLHVRRVSGAEDEYVLFYQTYLGMEVFGSEILVMVNGDNVTATVGGLLPAGVVLDTYPLVDAEQAVEIAREEIGNSDAFVVGETIPMIYDPSVVEEVPSDPHLVWRVPLGPGSTQIVYVDAHSGDVLMVADLSFEGYELDHEDANGYPDGDEDCYWYTTDDDWIGDEDGLLSSYADEPDAANSWLAIRDTYYFFANQYGRDSYDGDGSEIELYIYSGTDNARWVGGTGCNLIEFHTGWVSWDIMAHEYAHGVQFFTSKIGMNGQRGQPFALKESLADIQSMFFDSNDWLQGDGRTGLPGYVRNIQSPKIGHMDDYDYSGTKAAGYDNSGIPSKAAYLTAVGGLQDFYMGPGLGRRNMGHLYYGVMVSLPTNASFLDARNLALAIAGQHFTTEQVCTVRNAWALVGIGNADVGCDGILDPDLTDTDDDYNIDTLDNCPDIYNPYQKDFDGDGIGDACDIDDDNDFVNDNEDNCPWLKNQKQMDTDGDGKGDPCDDEDKDGVIDVHDNCPLVPNSNQVDSDEDGVGNACDRDLDGDGINEQDRDGFPLDNCPFEYNPDQLDSDGDGIGDACDGCPNDPDTNQAYTAVDPFLLSQGALPEPYQPDSDGDGIPDACDEKVSIDDLRVHAEVFSWEPDGRRHKVEVQGEPGSFLKVPVPLCEPEEDWIPRNYWGQIVMEGVDDKVGVWLGDSAGFGAGITKEMGDQRSVNFQPRGGEDYFLLVGFHPAYPSNQLTQFDMLFECVERAIKESAPDESFQPPDVENGSPPVVEQTPTEVPEEEQPPEQPAASRCDLFTGDYPLSTLEIPYGTTAFSLYIQIPGGVPGLGIEIPGDDQPWEYAARLGRDNADVCEQRYFPERLYCDFTLPQIYLGSVQPLSIFVNGCDQPIFGHERVTINAPEEPEPTDTPEPVCSEELDEDACVEVGGSYECSTAGALICSCVCP